MLVEITTAAPLTSVNKTQHQAEFSAPPDGASAACCSFTEPGRFSAPRVQGLNTRYSQTASKLRSPAKPLGEAIRKGSNDLEGREQNSPEKHLKGFIQRCFRPLQLSLKKTPRR